MLHVTARIKLFKTEAGGRTSFVRSGYRPNLRFGDLYTEGALTFPDRQQMYPGAEGEVCVTLVHPEYVREHLVVSAHFDLMEGARKVGEGTLLAVPAALQKTEAASGAPVTADVL
ncbi:MAG: hypothetical protein FJZ47_10810 [Candidatus Tectomicrobia bacterium]|uniref:Translation elongation factor EFTu/EF1A C-terminal domain-containing protein n=1 Tax=Tectimicrobiota bacterium TaxID=2528274 RepID=A0A938B2J4_UNCTE|nr:hypothetical protein [Candidatus Tectomicrobia bacterium]